MPDRLVQTFCDLVRTDSPSGEEEAVARDLHARLTALGFTVTRDGYGNLLAFQSGEAPRLLLSAHMDTVEPGRGVQPQVTGDRIESGGTTVLGGDCKAGIAAILEALESLSEDNAARVPVQLVFTRQEEIGLVGAKNLDFSLVAAKEAVIFDGDGPVNHVTIASPTYVSFDVRITGRAAHAGVEPEKGLSAIRIAAEIIAQLPQGRIDLETTFNVATVSGGTVRNAVPEQATFAGEFRSRNPVTREAMRGRLVEALETARRRYPKAVLQETLETEFQGYSLTPDDPLVMKVSRTLRSLGLEPRLEPSGGGTDANIFSRQGIRGVVVGIATQAMHTTREFVPIPDLLDVARFCQALLTDPQAPRPLRRPRR
ncbi:MAG: M20/M25/M40 family metallo-hydrolase [Chloroflexi bacterium]|nr:M20/M25/M40 family metallo-hydrolase [Chloroflexota bacterium]